MKTKRTAFTAFTAQTLDFLRELARNNNREWFTANRARYEAAKGELEGFVGQLLLKIGEFEQLPNTEVKDCIFRINRDIRFSKDKSPYKLHFAVAVGPGGRHSGRIDYYLHLQPGNQSFLGAGMWQPTPAQLAKYRQEVDYNVAELKSIIEAPDFHAYFPEISGESTKTAPKGYSADHPEITLLRRKELFFIHRYTDKEVLRPDFVQEVVKGCRLIQPFCQYLNYLFYDEPDEKVSL